MNTVSSFQLEIQEIKKVCQFRLTWDNGQRIIAQLPYDDLLTTRYQTWQGAYLNVYKRFGETKNQPLQPSDDASSDELRGRVISSDTVPVQIDWQRSLVEAELRLLQTFHRWLRNEVLDDIQSEISNAIAHDVTVFLTCEPLTLARLPWETWNLGRAEASPGTIRLVRTPMNIRASATATHCLTESRSRRGKPRILAILGDDSGLDFAEDYKAVRSLMPVAEVQFVGWQSGETAIEVKQKITHAIADPDGWDLLFFAGHSNENSNLGGELAIAPNVSITIHEIEPYLTMAKQRGLKVAIFNSCKGLDIAQSLIDLGLSQVVVMREPIHNRVAQVFLAQLLRNLAAHQTIYESLTETCKFLQLQISYPSAYLVPSLFCHPGAELFRIPPNGWREFLQRSLPTRWQSMVLAIGVTLSVFPIAQQALLDWRIGVQAVYRDVTQQVPIAPLPPVALVQIDEESVGREPRLKNPNPISRSYLADLVKQLAQQNAKTIGIDYLLDRKTDDQAMLQQAIADQIKQHSTWFVFGSLFSEFEAEAKFVAAKYDIAQPTWSLQGYTEAFEQYLMLPTATEDCRQTCPFAYVLATLDTAQREIPNQLPRPQLNRSQDLRSELFAIAEQSPPQNTQLAALQRSRQSLLAGWFHDVFGVSWFQPVIDFSIPPHQVYNRIAAWRLNKSESFPDLSQQIVLIIPAAYAEAGLIPSEPDHYPLPLATRYWRDRFPPTNNAAAFPGQHANTPDYLLRMPGGEIHAYTIHHLLTQRFVIPIPDLWMVGIAGLLGKWMTLYWQYRQRQLPQINQKKRWKASWLLLGGATSVYGITSLQLYVSAAILLPWVLPSFVLWLFILPTLKRRKNV